MRVQRSFFRAVLDAPDKDEFRSAALIYADWLNDQGEYEEAEVWGQLSSARIWLGLHGGWISRIEWDGKPMHTFGETKSDVLRRTMRKLASLNRYRRNEDV